MRPVHFEQSNITFNKPESMTDEQCYSISAYIGQDDVGYFVNTIWQPNKEDIDAILAGRGIVLNIRGASMPPVALFTFDENGNINE